MTIAVVWYEDNLLWCAADTRLVAGSNNQTTSEVAAKIYSIQCSISAINPEVDPRVDPHQTRLPHFWTRYGFVYAGSALPAAQTAITSSTLLQNLVRLGERTSPPRFEDIAELVKRLSSHFMNDKRRFGADGLFQAAILGWYPYENKFKVALIDGRDDATGFRVELSYPTQPNVDGEPWVILGSGRETFNQTLAEYRRDEKHITKRVPRRVIDRMVYEEKDQTVGGAISIGAANEFGFDLFYALEAASDGDANARRVFNGLDLDTDVGEVGQYYISTIGIA